ncbi:MAG: anthranilate synthase component II [Bacteroidales bacterium]
MNLLILDNNDSFTWNLYQLAREAGAGKIKVIRTENLKNCNPGKYDSVIFSPGPGLPDDFPGMFNLLEKFYKKKILGVCLGMQAISVYFGATLENMKEVRHGKQIKINVIEHHYIFNDIPGKFDGGLYHSWVISEKNFPPVLTVTSLSEDNKIMAIKHKDLDIGGIQFHPESIMTPFGYKIMKNWLCH